MICKCCINCHKQNCNTQKTDIETFTKHLELIQSAITSLSGHSFSMKQWCLTIVTIIVSVLTLTKENSLNDEIKLVIFIGVVALTLCFWYLDSFYLLSERKLRKLYEDSIKKNKNDEEIDLFSMDTKKIKESEYYSIIGVMFSRTELPLYLIILILELLLAGVYFMNNNIIKNRSFYTLLCSCCLYYDLFRFCNFYKTT